MGIRRRALVSCVALTCAIAPVLGCGARGPSARRPATGNHPPSVRARCEPCRVEAGARAAVSVEATDPDGDTLTFRWSAASGTLAASAERQTTWTAPLEDGAVPLTVEVRDGKGGVATDAVTIYVSRAGSNVR